MNLKNVEIVPSNDFVDFQRGRMKGLELEREREKKKDGEKTERKQERHRDEDAV